MKEVKIIVVGGGISGLSLSYYLLKKKEHLPLKVILIEKNERTGGNIITERYGEFLIEGGPDCFISEKPWAVELIKELGDEGEITGTIPENNRTYIYWNKRLWPLPEGWALLAPTKFLPFLKTGLISLKGKLRASLDLFLPRGKKDDETLADFVQRRLGREILEKIAEPLVAGIHSADPQNMSLKATFPRFLEMERKYRSLIFATLKMKRMRREFRENSIFLTLKRGLSHLTEKLENVLMKEGVKIFKGKEIKTIEKREGVFFLVGKGNEIFKGDIVVLTTPAWVSAGILKDLSEELSEILLRIPFVSTLTLSLAFRKDKFPVQFDGYGFLIPSLEKMNLLACTWMSNKFPSRAPSSHHLLRCFGGGYKNEEIIEKSDEEIYKDLLSSLFLIFGRKAEPEFAKIYRWKKAMPQYHIGHIDLVNKIERISEGIGGLYLAGSSYRGIGISDCVKDGKTIAEKIINSLFRRGNY